MAKRTLSRVSGLSWHFSNFVLRASLCHQGPRRALPKNILTYPAE